MSAPKSKYDYPGLPLWDRDGNPVGVGDVVETPTWACRFKVYHIGKTPVLWDMGDPDYGAMIPEALDPYQLEFNLSEYRLVMPPGFPKDRRWGEDSDTFRFVDDWHGYWLAGSYKGTAEQRHYPCSDTACWEFDGDGNPVKAKATIRKSRKVEPAPEPTELDRLRERVEAMRLDVEQVRNIAETARDDARIASDAIEQISAIQSFSTPAETTPNTETLPTDPADWEPCEWDGKTFPVFMRDNINDREIWRFDDQCAAERIDQGNPGDKLYFSDYNAHHKDWTPVRPKRRQPEPDPQSDEALKAWFWENARRVDVRNLGSYLILNWLKPDCSTPTGITVNADTFIDALRSLRKQVMERENGGAE